MSHESLSDKVERWQKDRAMLKDFIQGSSLYLSDSGLSALEHAIELADMFESDYYADLEEPWKE